MKPQTLKEDEIWMKLSLKHRIFTRVLLVIFVTSILITRPMAFGQQGRPALLAQKLTGIDATSSLTQDFTLPSGFRLSGMASGPGNPLQLTATSESNSFTYLFSSASRSFRLDLPEDMYTLSAYVGYTDFATASILGVTHSQLDTVNLTSDTTKNLTLPARPQTVLVQGSVTRSGNLPIGTMAFTSEDGKIVALYVGGGSRYRILVPVGTYFVQMTYLAPLSQLNLGSNVREELTIPLTKVTISANQTLDLVVPSVPVLSGTILDGSGAGAVPARVTANGAGGFATVTVPGQNADGKYMVLLPAGTYDLTVGVTLKLDPNEGLVTFPSPALKLEVNADTSQDFVKPATPTVVTISGKVTDANGNPVGNAKIKAESSELTDFPNATFSSGTDEKEVTSKSDGTYTMQVLAGKNYTLTCTP